MSKSKLLHTLLIALTGAGALACAAGSVDDDLEPEGAGASSAVGTGAQGNATTSSGGSTTTSTGSSGGAANPVPPGSGGSSGGSGGSAAVGSGGSTTVPVTCTAATGSSPLIDDLADNDKNLILAEGRDGKWAVAADAAGTLGESAGEVAPSNGEYCLEASGHNQWGANLSAYLVEPRACYDASAYSGVCFKARGAVTTPSVDEEGNITGTTDGTVVFSVSKSSSEYDNCGDTCSPTHSVDLANADLDPVNYQEFCFDWADLKADDVGLSDASDLWRLEWKLPSWSWKGVEASVDGVICVDDVTFK